MYLKLLTYFYVSYLAMAFDSSPENSSGHSSALAGYIVVDPHHIDADPDPTFHPDADPYSYLGLKKERKPSNQSAKIGLYSIPILLDICKLMRIRYGIQLINFDPDQEPQHWLANSDFHHSM